MLKSKLNRNRAVLNDSTADDKDQRRSNDDANKMADLEMAPPVLMTSNFFATPFWKQFYDIECKLNEELRIISLPAHITCAYNPIEYAAELHCAYLRRYLNGPKRLLMVGMNPGPNGMGQTGVPFGNIGTVRDIMKLSGAVQQPPRVHPKRPVTGLQCTTEEPSGIRIWTLLQRLAGGSLDVFAQKCFVHNFCPLAFFDKDGKNITPSELKGEYKTKIRDVSLSALDNIIALTEPEIIVAIGDYVYTCLKRSQYSNSNIRMLKLPHPSPRALNNQNWPEKAEKMIVENDLLKYIRNEI